MKSSLFTIAFLLFFIVCVPASFAQGWGWARSAGGTNEEAAYGAATDAAGNVYLTGTFLSDTLIIGGTTLYNFGGGNRVFTCAYSPSGTPLWANSALGAPGSNAYAITTDAAGSVYVTGSFSDRITFNGTDSLTNPPAASNFFVVKYTSAGAFVWARQGHSPVMSSGSKIATDAYGHVYITGNFTDTLTIGDSVLYPPLSWYPGMFIASYDTAGNLLWAHGMYDPVGNNASALCTAPGGNIYAGITGSLQFIIDRYDTAGNMLWTWHSGASAGQPQLNEFSADNSGHIYASGSYSGGPL